MGKWKNFHGNRQHSIRDLTSITCPKFLRESESCEEIIIVKAVVTVQ